MVSIHIYKVITGM